MEMTREQIWNTARRQSALELGCAPEDFDRPDSLVVDARTDPRARKYLELPFACHLVSYGGNVVAAVQPEFRAPAEQFLSGRPARWCFETPGIYALNERLAPLGHKVCFLSEYFLPEPEELRAPACGCTLRVLHPADFAPLYRDEWSNALSRARPELDVLGVGAYDRDMLIGLAACSADCEDMWQIGVDVLPAYRRQGVGEALTGALTKEILACGKVPFYCAAWANLPSVRGALRCGYRPAWVELSVRPAAFTDAAGGV